MSRKLIKILAAFGSTIYGLAAAYGWYSFASPTGTIANIVTLFLSTLYFLVTTPTLYAYWTQEDKSEKEKSQTRFMAEVKKYIL